MSKEMGKKYYAKNENDVVYKNDTVTIPHARLLPGSWRNFSGRDDTGYNGNHRREFTIKLNADYNFPEDSEATRIANEEAIRIKNELLDIGYSIKVREPKPEQIQKDPNIQPLEYIKVQVNCPGDHDDNPKWQKRWDSEVYLKTSKGLSPEPLHNRNIHILDKAEIIDVNLRIRPYTWTMFAGKDGRIPYGYRPIVDKMVITIKEDDFDKNFME